MVPAELFKKVGDGIQTSTCMVRMLSCVSDYTKQDIYIGIRQRQ